jgi:hypothetical protein
MGAAAPFFPWTRFKAILQEVRGRAVDGFTRSSPKTIVLNEAVSPVRLIPVN